MPPCRKTQARRKFCEISTSLEIVAVGKQGLSAALDSAVHI